MIGKNGAKQGGSRPSGVGQGVKPLVFIQISRRCENKDVVLTFRRLPPSVKNSDMTFEGLLSEFLYLCDLAGNVSERVLGDTCKAG